MKIFILPIALALFLIQSTSYAMDHGGDSSDAKRLYAGVDAGVGLVDGASNPFIGKAYLGWNFDTTNIFSVELGYFESAVSNASGSILGVPVTGWSKVRGGDLVLLARPLANHGLEHFFIRAGGHYSQVKAGATAFGWGGSASITGTDDGVGWLAGAGFDIPITESISARAAYGFYGAFAGVKGIEANVITGGFQFKF